MSTSPYACGFAWRKRCAKCRQFKALLTYWQADKGYSPKVQA